MDHTATEGTPRYPQAGHSLEKGQHQEGKAWQQPFSRACVSIDPKWAAMEAGGSCAGKHWNVQPGDAAIPKDGASSKRTVARQPQRRMEEMRNPWGCCLESTPLCRSRSTHQGLKGCALHEVIVQVTVGHHPVYLDTAGERI